MSRFFHNLYMCWYFRDESKQARQIALERPRNWEYLLTLHLLNDLLAKWKSAFDQIHTSSNRVLGHSDWLKAKILFLADAAKKLSPTLCQDLVAAWGAPGKHGDGIAIKRAITRLDGICRELYEWEVEVASTHFPRGERVKALMMGCLTNVPNSRTLKCNLPCLFAFISEIPAHIQIMEKPAHRTGPFLEPPEKSRDFLQ